ASHIWRRWSLNRFDQQRHMTKDTINLDWSIEEFMECVGFIQSQTSNPNELWDLLQNAGGFIEINGQ
ncbi:hypothetical protein ACED34_25800, partial [Vibrio splendidus]|uniref:hypothetical protein n=1 Tax=Vibrio splendidus TaxID=29497 RepID=UPI00352CEE51